eukprot:CAMPEP_0206364144 /NCGR_PEP_ID=MMETSP0294-20121207/2029_1 /ASSEMBLY_ACC=CAM_ASM_000327 /TAXON_ID=39354 /ORGANISM="Heterosigma akashiwo, Strain CCMP2393" /LENGTH=116 /DNA_ID=CAMNT_0053809657 /DNA_START=51 /DNA_END=397 /DNA_ORIENTATION=-
MRDFLEIHDANRSAFGLFKRVKKLEIRPFRRRYPDNLTDHRRGGAQAARSSYAWRSDSDSEEDGEIWEDSVHFSHLEDGEIPEPSSAKKSHSRYSLDGGSASSSSDEDDGDEDGYG